jgi:cytidine deaminase
VTAVTPQQEALYARADEARARAYAPYSSFTVGAALRGADGSVVTAANVENASYGLTICAERSAVVRALAHGVGAFEEIAVAADPAVASVPPCGACRQVLVEFAPALVVVYRRDGELVALPLADLLPGAFAHR